MSRSDEVHDGELNITMPLMPLSQHGRPGNFCHILQPQNCLACAPSVASGTVRDALKVIEAKHPKQTYMFLVAFIMPNAVSSNSGR